MNFRTSVFWAKNALFRRRAMSLYATALENEGKSEEELAEINWTKRKQIVAYAYENSNFYRNFYEENGFSPADLRCREDWSKVPILEKEHIRQHRDRILCRGIDERNRIKTTTGGSTGLPMLTYRDARFPEEIIKWRMLRRWSRTPAEHKIMLWRIPDQVSSLRSRVLNALIWWPTSRYKFDVSSIAPASLLEMERILLEKNPGIIWGYVGALQELADHLLSRKIRLNYDPLVWATASPMSHAQIDKFKKAFGRKILDQYACSEIHWVASNEPGSRDLVIDFDYRHVDIVDSENDDRESAGTGEILLTDMENRVFPLIRYRNGDRARMLPRTSRTESPFPRLSPVQGRISDAIRTVSGALIPGEYLTTIFDDHFEYIDRFCIVQRKDYSLDIVIKPSGLGISASFELDQVINIVTKKFSAKVGKDIDFRIRIVKEIGHDGGKVRFVRSELS